MSGLPLRTRLVAGLLLVTAVAFLVVGLVTTLSLSTYLVRRTDETVLSAVPPGPPGGRGPAGTPDRIALDRARSVWDLTVALDDDQAVVVAYRSPETLVLSEADVAALQAVPVGGTTPVTVDLGAAGSFRMVALPWGDSGQVLVGGDSLASVWDTVRRLVLIEGLVFAAVLVVVGIAGTVLVRLSLRPLRRVATTATAVAALPLSDGTVAIDVRVPEADPRTEVGQVATAFNEMLNHVEASLQERQRTSERLRRFVSDAGHELRTPLAAIRGYAELFRRAGRDHPEQAEVSADRIESAASRMGVLVDDLLLLARLDEGQPLTPSPVDLVATVSEAVDEARAAGPHHHWQIRSAAGDSADTGGDGKGPVWVLGDPVRLHQVVANLLANVRAHTPEGTTATVQVTVEDAQAVLEVADDGPGIPADLVPRVTERFTRADLSRSRASGGSGLGLSIVAAIVAAHDGTLSVQSPPGAGTRVTMRLPLAPVQGAEATGSSSGSTTSGSRSGSANIGEEIR
ncbi:MAG: HAMP domain-containing protein [Actinomycetota bacterium]|nr:MAG: HAMP domain-containing protein [Actinomycetota bacterium]